MPLYIVPQARMDGSCNSSPRWSMSSAAEFSSSASQRYISRLQVVMRAMAIFAGESSFASSSCSRAVSSAWSM